MVEFYSGRVVAVTFANTENSFYIMKVRLDQADGGEGVVTTVRGNVQSLPIQVGSWFGFEGEWQTHKQWGEQLVITKAPVLKNGFDSPTASKFLVSNGVNPKTVLLLQNHLKDDFVPALSDVQKLQDIPGMTVFTATFVKTKWAEVLSWFAAVDMFDGLGVSKALSKKIMSKFGDEAVLYAKTNPWKFVQVDGFDFSSADLIAEKHGLDLTCYDRVVGATLHTIKNQKGMGHLYVSSGDVVNTVMDFCPATSPQEIAKALKELVKDSLVIVDKVPGTNANAIYEPWFHLSEDYSADLLIERTRTAKFSPEQEINYIKRLAAIGPKTALVASNSSSTLREVAGAAVDEWCSMTHLNLSKTQREGVVNALIEPISVLTGLPGTGKSTSMKVAVKVLQDAGVSFLLIAPTGIAAKRLASVTGATASTVHRAFGAKGSEQGSEREATYNGFLQESAATISSDGSSEAWGYSENNPHPAEVVLVDESSMVDQALMYRLMTCTSKTCRLVFIGDAAQLPSVGPGNVLRDMISSDIFPVVNLVDIFRQQDTSGIVTASHAIHRGEVPDLQNMKDFVFLPLQFEDECLTTILKISEKLYNTRQNFQVITSRHMGTVGVTNMNSRLRELLNPQVDGVAEMKFKDWSIREGDRVMVVRNNYKLDIYNGDIGKISKIDKAAREVEIKIHGPPVITVRIGYNDISSHLRLAYATTTHKVQGLEFDTIVMPFVDSFSHQLQRNLLYTAVTRAKKRVIIVGHQSAIQKAVLNSREDSRNTLFVDRMRKYLLTSTQTDTTVDTTTEAHYVQHPPSTDTEPSRVTGAP